MFYFLYNNTSSYVMKNIKGIRNELVIREFDGKFSRSIKHIQSLQTPYIFFF